MKINKPVSKEAFRRAWGVQFNSGENRIKFVELVTLSVNESRKAEHVHKQNERFSNGCAIGSSLQEFF